MHAREQNRETRFTRDDGEEAPSVPSATLLELRALSRLEFYRTLGRRAPTRLISVPSYVRAVKRHFNLDSGNQARAYLAQVEGFNSWSALMNAMLRAS